MTTRVVQILCPLSLVIRIKSKTSTIPSRSRYCLPRDDPLCMDSLLTNTWSGAQFHKICMIVRLWRVWCAYIHSHDILGCLLICYLFSSTDPLPRYEVTMFLRVFTWVNLQLGEESYRQTLYSISKFQSMSFIRYLTDAKVLEYNSLYWLLFHKEYFSFIR
jgi:hypothetical protein